MLHVQERGLNIKGSQSVEHATDNDSSPGWKRPVCAPASLSQGVWPCLFSTGYAILEWHSLNSWVRVHKRNKFIDM